MHKQNFCGIASDSVGFAKKEIGLGSIDVFVLFIEVGRITNAGKLGLEGVFLSDACSYYKNVVRVLKKAILETLKYGWVRSKPKLES